MTALKRIAHAVILSWGWGRFFLALVAGALGALALPPFAFLPAMVVSMTVAVWLLDGAASGVGRFSRRTLWSAAWTGWAFGFGYFLAGLWWLGAAFLVEPDQFALLMPLGVVGLPAGLALFPALGFALARVLWSPGPARILALAAGLTASEWLRGTVLTGFPWNAYGMALGDHMLLSQTASLIGLHGLTLLAVGLCAAPATLATATDARGRWLAPGLAALLLAGLAVFGWARVPSSPTPTVAGVQLRIMQPNLQQDEKFRPENRQAVMARYLSLSDRATSPERPGMEGVTHLVWPESSFPFLVARDPQALAQIGALLPRGSVLLAGAVRAQEPLPGENRPHYFNAIHVIGDDGSILASADKVHLVPFGEYLPLSGLLTTLGLRQFVNTPGGFEPGSRHVTLSVPGLPLVAPLICYEAIFPGEVVPPGSRPGVLLNVTNDGWFGITPGPYQHLAQARLRAVEEGLPLIRAANTGISAVADPYGRFVARLPLGVEGVLDSKLPEALEPTLFSRFGSWIPALLLTAATFLSGLAVFRI
jgi:apolipoprotein N-acyltransferase